MIVQGFMGWCVIYAVNIIKFKFREMKRFKKTIMTLFAACLFAACDPSGSDVIWDIAPINFSIHITDAQGNDLLDSTYQQNLIKDISVSYQGETYPVMTEQEAYGNIGGGARTRAYLAFFRGLLLTKHWNYKTFTYEGYKVVFGEFNGDESINKREITLTMPDGHQAKLAYRNNFKWKSNGDPKISRQFFLDDQELKDDYGKGGTYHFEYTAGQGLRYVPGSAK